MGQWIYTFCGSIYIFNLVLIRTYSTGIPARSHTHTRHTRTHDLPSSRSHFSHQGASPTGYAIFPIAEVTLDLRLVGQGEL